MSASHSFEIPLYFDPKRIGESMYQVSEEKMQTKSHKVHTIWFTGYDNVDLFIWEDKNANILKQQLCYCGQIVEWNIVEGVKTGVIIEEESFQPGVSPSESIIYDQEKVENSIQQALILINFITAMDSTRKMELISNLKSNSTVDSMSHEEFWEKFGDENIAYSRSKTIMGFKILWSYFKKMFKTK